MGRSRVPFRRWQVCISTRTTACLPRSSIRGGSRCSVTSPTTKRGQSWRSAKPSRTKTKQSRRKQARATRLRRVLRLASRNREFGRSADGQTGAGASWLRVPKGTNAARLVEVTAVTYRRLQNFYEKTILHDVRGCAGCRSGSGADLHGGLRADRN